MINENALKAFLRKKFNATSVDIRKIGSGVQGTGFIVELKTGRRVSSYVVKSLASQDFGHDYPSDRAAVFLLDLDEFNNLPGHVKALDVLAEMADGSVKSVGGGREYYLLMEKGEGRDYFQDLNGFSKKNRLEDLDITRIRSMASYLANIHAVKKDSKTLYWRKLRDTVGHGECLMGIFDIYPEGTLPSDEMAKIVKKSVDWIFRLKPHFGRLAQIHGDFHPGNIWFRDDNNFVLLDRSRGPWGEPADDVTALTINYIFFSLRHHAMVRGPYLEALQLFYDEYVRLSGDHTIFSVVQPFYAFRGVVVANPVFYPQVNPQQRTLLFRFVNNVLDSELFEPERINEYLK
jgi:hypothetical protein